MIAGVIWTRKRSPLVSEITSTLGFLVEEVALLEEEINVVGVSEKEGASIGKHTYKELFFKKQPKLEELHGRAVACPLGMHARCGSPSIFVFDGAVAGALHTSNTHS